MLLTPLKKAKSTKVFFFRKGWGGPHELRALEASLNIKFEIWLATFNELEEVTDI